MSRELSDGSPDADWYPLSSEALACLPKQEVAILADVLVTGARAVLACVPSSTWLRGLRRCLLCCHLTFQLTSPQAQMAVRVSETPLDLWTKRPAGIKGAQD